MLLAAGLVEYAWVVGGAVLTLVIAGAVLYWIDEEWQRRDAAPPSPPPAERETRPPGETT